MINEKSIFLNSLLTAIIPYLIIIWLVTKYNQPNKNIEITSDYTNTLKNIQESGIFYRTLRRDRAKETGEVYGKNLVYPEYRTKNVTAYLKSNDSYQGTQVSDVLAQCDGYWVLNRKALIDKHKLETSDTSNRRFGKTN